MRVFEYTTNSKKGHLWGFVEREENVRWICVLHPL